MQQITGHAQVGDDAKARGSPPRVSTHFVCALFHRSTAQPLLVRYRTPLTANNGPRYRLFALRETSLAVIEAIERWRAALWKPLPFVWRDTNYLLKMRDDLTWMSGNKAQRILDRCVSNISLRISLRKCNLSAALVRLMSHPSLLDSIVADASYPARCFCCPP